MAWIRAHQLSIMLFMSGICGILSFLTLITNSLSGGRKRILTLMELSSMLLLLLDRVSYLYRGDPSELGFLAVRLSNGLVYFLDLFIPFLVTRYLKDLYQNDGHLQASLRRFLICDILFVAGSILIIVSQFTGLYYTIDAQNYYHRAPGNALSYVVPVLIVLMQESVILQYRKRLNRHLVLALALSIALPTAASIVQFFHYGLSLTNMTMVIVVIVFYFYALKELSKTAENAMLRELEFYKEGQKKEAALFVQTTEALANAIDAKDKYTRGHSARVATISRQIANEAGLSEKVCNEVYFAALLHDVGKIGIRDEIINKVGKLTDEEFEQIKQHPILGYQILSSIQLSPSLSVGAHYHHERFDGKGYPEGLSGEDIPEIARIIAVADAYDAMTSKRSYRNPLTMQNVYRELTEGMGKQFDPVYAGTLLRLLESGGLQKETSQKS